MPVIRPETPGRLAQKIASLSWGAEEQPEPPVRIEFTGDKHMNAHIRLERTGDNQKASALNELRKILPVEDVEQLMAQEDLLFRWLEKHPKNPTMFVLDPVSCLKEAGLKVSGRALERLSRHREGIRRILPTDAYENLASLVVDLKKP
jgi:hypothetical protein